MLHSELLNLYISHEVAERVFENTLDLQSDSQEELRHYRASKELLLFLSLFDLVHALHYLDKYLLEVEIAERSLVYVTEHDPIHEVGEEPYQPQIFFDLGRPLMVKLAGYLQWLLKLSHPVLILCKPLQRE